ncbi:MAG: WYL domain-containing protein [Candidatus Actinomarinales bacterium]|nr:MAG: WYL domain-containing protein [Candidatus Actinomarinales bacterium]
MKNVLKRCVSLLTLFNEKSIHLSTDYIKDNISEYRNLSDTAFKRSFERDKVLLREMGYNLDYIKDKWTINEGYNLSGTAIISDIKKNEDVNFQKFLNTYHIIKNYLNSNNEITENKDYISKLNKSIIDKKRVSFNYQNKLRKVYPMGIKFFNDNWYLGAEENKKLKTFSLRKISNLKIGNKSDLHEKDYKKIQFSWESKDYLISIKIHLEKEIYLINKNVFNHSVISKNQTNNLLELVITTYDVHGLLRFLLLTNPKKLTISKKHKILLLEVLNV